MGHGKKYDHQDSHLVNDAHVFCMNRFSCCHARYQQQSQRPAYYQMMI